jgi:DNA modification methylase
MSVQILRGNALALPLADDTVDLVVTSPPYFGLRSYQDGGEHYDGQIGDEATPAEFVDALIAATAEMVRVVKPTGSIWVNLGDKYAGSRMDGSSGWATAPLDHDSKKKQLSKLAASQGVLRTSTTIPTKSLMGIPWRYALRCIDDLGLILRAEVIWSKPNGLPESVTDRVRRSHEQWFHFTLSPRYYSAVDEIREAHSENAHPRRKDGGISPQQSGLMASGAHRGNTGLSVASHNPNPLGKLPGSVWTIPTEPLHVPDHLGIDHFAAYPTEWPRRIVQGWSPRGICVECGEGRRPVVERARQNTRPVVDIHALHGAHEGDDRRGFTRGETAATITGEACACPEPTAPTRPGLVLDPFGGTGTTALVADALGRDAVHVDMSADYCRLATWRTNDPKQRAKAARREFKPPTPQLDGQLDLLEGLGA